ncbi:hypothetical protein SEMRO_22_G015070.1 [Seminavis robusta]|uniref:Uncharacterized protein n=1 Tax=Seminavis robusta TaxID=568900 RepID=A0A9N8H2N7_9STRA|nr:hypothetical protein SEMRO_22_G015070.1 [Seminavis robusta]|eukprot:Sro22_g015070.1 n/a (200) ;mRNA; r:170-845
MFSRLPAAGQDKSSGSAPALCPRTSMGDSQLLGNGSDPKTLLGRTAQWLTCGITENICVLIVKLYGDVEEDPSSDGTMMALINREGVQWIRSWGDTVEKDDHCWRVFLRSISEGLLGGANKAANKGKPQAVKGRAGWFSLPHFDEKPLSGFEPGEPATFSLTQQAGLLEEGDPTAIFRDDATIAIDSDCIYENYQDLFS